MTTAFPTIGKWFRRPNGTLLEVVAIDEDDGTIEIQLFDGTIDEIELDAWRDQLLLEVAAPEDWSGSVDIAREDFTVDRDGTRPHDWSSHLDYLDSSE